MDLAVGYEVLDLVVALAAGADNKLTGAVLRVRSPIRVLRREALVVVLVGEFARGFR